MHTLPMPHTHLTSARSYRLEMMRFPLFVALTCSTGNLGRDGPFTNTLGSWVRNMIWPEMFAHNCFTWKLHFLNETERSRSNVMFAATSQASYSHWTSFDH